MKFINYIKLCRYYKYKFRCNIIISTTNIRMNRLKRSWHPCLTILIISELCGICSRLSI